MALIRLTKDQLPASLTTTLTQVKGMDMFGVTVTVTDWVFPVFQVVSSLSVNHDSPPLVVKLI